MEGARISSARLQRKRAGHKLAGLRPVGCRVVFPGLIVYSTIVRKLLNLSECFRFFLCKWQVATYWFLWVLWEKLGVHAELNKWHCCITHGSCYLKWTGGCWGGPCNTTVKLLLGTFCMPCQSAWVPVLPLLPIQVLATVHPGVMSQVFGSLQPMWEIQMEFCTSDSGLAQLWLLQAFGRSNSGGRSLSVCVCLSVSCSAFQRHKIKQESWIKSEKHPLKVLGGYQTARTQKSKDPRGRGSRTWNHWGTCQCINEG